MTFSVALPLGGASGWQFLKATEDQQKQAIAEAQPQKRDVDHFREKTGSITSVKEFVGDPRLMRVALGAFGLEADVTNRAFIERILTDGTENDTALANRLADKTYLAFAEAFPVTGSGTLGPFDTESIVSKFQKRQFEAAVGLADEDLRIALYLERSLAEITTSTSNERAMYFKILGDPPLRLAFETAFGLPGSFASIDIDRQVDILANAVSKRFSSDTLAQFKDPEATERLVQLFLVRASAPATTPQNIAAQTALALLTA
ncbi:MAG: DUF1217 domain-containing protein [Pseudomonadota bacterium]